MAPKRDLDPGRLAACGKLRGRVLQQKQLRLLVLLVEEIDEPDDLAIDERQVKVVAAPLIGGDLGDGQIERDAGGLAGVQLRERSRQDDGALPLTCGIGDLAMQIHWWISLVR